MYELLYLLLYICHIMATYLFVYLFIYIFSIYLFIYLLNNFYTPLFHKFCASLLNSYSYFMCKHIWKSELYTHIKYFFFLFSVFLCLTDKKGNILAYWCYWCRVTFKTWNMILNALCRDFFAWFPSLSARLSFQTHKTGDWPLQFFCNTFRYWPLQFIFMARAWCSEIFLYFALTSSVLTHYRQIHLFSH